MAKPALIQSEKSQKFVIALVMGVVFLGSLAIAWAMKPSQQPIGQSGVSAPRWLQFKSNRIPVPQTWSETTYSHPNIPVTHGVTLTDPTSPQRKLTIARILAPKPARPVEVFKAAIAQVIVNYPGQVRLTVPRPEGEPYYYRLHAVMTVPVDQTAHQHMLALLVPRRSDNPNQEFLVVYLRDVITQQTAERQAENYTLFNQVCYFAQYGPPIDSSESPDHQIDETKPNTPEAETNNSEVQPSVPDQTSDSDEAL